MASNDNITARIKVDGAKEAQKQIEGVADVAKKLDGETVDVAVDAKTKDALTDIDSLMSKVDKLDGKSADLLLKSNSKAINQEISDLVGQLDKLDANDPKVDVIASDLSRLNRDLEQIDRKADELDRQRTTVTVTADTTKAETALARLRGGVGGIGEALTANIGAALGTIGAAVGAFAAKAIGDFQDTALGAGELRDALGVTAEEASRLQEVAEDIGVGADAMQSAMARMIRAVELTPGKFDEVGAAIARNRDGTIDVTETFINAIDALNKIPDAGQRAARAQEIFGKGWQGIAELIAAGADDVRDALASVESGKIMSDADIERGRRFRDMLDEVKGVAEGASIQVGEDLVDSIEDLNTIVDQVKGPLEDFIALLDSVPGGKAVRDWAVGIAVPITQIPRALDFVADAISGDDITAHVADDFRNTAEAAGELTEMTEEDTAALEENNKKRDDAAQALRDQAAAAQDAQAAIDDLAGAFEQMEIREGALKPIFDLGNAPLDALSQIRDVEDGIRDLQWFVAQEGRIPNIFDASDMDANELLEKFAALRGPIQEQITATFAAGGDWEAVAAEWVDKIFFAMGGKMSKEDIEQMLGLGDLEAQIDVALKQSAVDKVKRQIDILTGVGAGNALTASIELALDAGAISPEAAEILVQAQLRGAGVLIPSALDTPDTAAAKREAETFLAQPGNAVRMRSTMTTPSTSDMDNALATAQRYVNGKQINVTAKFNPKFNFGDAGTPSMPQPGGIAGEIGPEILNGRYLITGPTWVPPGTRVTSRRQTARILRTRGMRGLRRYDNGGTVPRAVSLTINAGVIGNRFDVARAVGRAQRDLERLTGTRR